jgi:hypothetical protein
LDAAYILLQMFWSFVLYSTSNLRLWTSVDLAFNVANVFNIVNSGLNIIFLTGFTGYSGLKHQNSSCKSSSKSFTLRLISTCPPSRAQARRAGFPFTKIDNLVTPILYSPQSRRGRKEVYFFKLS